MAPRMFERGNDPSTWQDDPLPHLLLRDRSYHILLTFVSSKSRDAMCVMINIGCWNPGRDVDLSLKNAGEGSMLVLRDDDMDMDMDTDRGLSITRLARVEFSGRIRLQSVFAIRFRLHARQPRS